MWLVAGHTDMRKGFNGLAAVAQRTLAANPFEGHVFVFRGARGDLLKVLWFDGQGLRRLPSAAPCALRPACGSQPGHRSHTAH